MIRVVTTFSQTGWLEYAQRFVETFNTFWPREIELILYVDWALPLAQRPVFGRSVTIRNLSDIPGHDDFIRELSPHPLLNGRVPRECWKSKDIADGYSYRTDVIKFCHKVFCVWHAAHVDPTGTLLWIDADVHTVRPVPVSLINDIMASCDVSYLGRDRATSECGFLGFNLPAARPLIDTWHEYYVENKFAAEREWHDSYLFDCARERVQGLYKNIALPGARGHVWVSSPLGPFTDHRKGERKSLPSSPEWKAAYGDVSK